MGRASENNQHWTIPGCAGKTELWLDIVYQRESKPDDLWCRWARGNDILHLS